MCHWPYLPTVFSSQVIWAFTLVVIQQISGTTGKIPPGLLVDIFCWGSGLPSIWISKGPKQNLKAPSIEIHSTNSPIFEGSIGPSNKILQGPHWIFRGPRALTSLPYLALWQIGLRNQLLLARQTLYAGFDDSVNEWHSCFLMEVLYAHDACFNGSFDHTSSHTLFVHNFIGFRACGLLCMCHVTIVVLCQKMTK